MVNFTTVEFGVKLFKMKFFDRKEQLSKMEEIRKRAYTNHSMFTIVTGRRRIGKTTLIEKSLIGETYLYFFVSKKNEVVLCREFITEARNKLDIFIPNGVNSFPDLFELLMQHGKSNKFTIVIDEFQNFTEVNESIFSDIQKIWDKYRLISNINLIVSGSVYSLMTKLFQDKKEPLYGRDDITIKLAPFQPSVLKDILNEYSPGWDNDDLLALYSFTGAIPKYIELLVDSEALTKNKMIEFICRADSPFIEEGKKLLIQEFGRKYGTYFSILQAISEGYNTHAEIADYLGSKSIGGHLLKLEETYNLIEKKRPMWAAEKTQTVRYEISDIFLRFWFRYFEKNQMLIEINQYPLLLKIMSEDYDTYTGVTLERYFKAKLIESLEYRAIGNWWNPKGYRDDKGNHQQCEIDLIGVRVDDKNVDIIEVKRNPEKFSQKLLEEKVKFLIRKERRLKKYSIKYSCLSLLDM